MKESVWKYTLSGGENRLSMPMNAIPLTVRGQHGAVCMWARCNALKTYEDRVFVVVGTGHKEIEPADTYIGTAMLADGMLVLHVFERLP